MITKVLFLIVTCIFIMQSSLAQNAGDMAPDFAVTSLTGSQIKLSNYAGKVVFIFFLGNNCPYCKAIGNDTETKVNQVYGNRPDFQAIGLDTWDASSSVSTLNAFKTYTGITYPLGLKAGSVATLYSTTYDRVMVIDKNGIIRHRSNLSTASDLQNAINTISMYIDISTGIKDVSDINPVKLHQNYPNPFRNSTTINFFIEKSGKVELSVVSLSGKAVKNILNENMISGEHQVTISSDYIKPGIYIYRLKSGNTILMKRMIIIE